MWAAGSFVLIRNTQARIPRNWHIQMRLIKVKCAVSAERVPNSDSLLRLGPRFSLQNAGPADF
jgi:hypothetical protein